MAREEWPRVTGWVRATVPERRLRLYDRRTEIEPGLEAREAGGHTLHHAFVEIACADRRVIVVGDAAYLPRNIEQGVPVAVTGSVRRTVRDLAAAVEAVGRANVLAGHSPALYMRYPSEVEGVAAICP